MPSQSLLFIDRPITAAMDMENVLLVEPAPLAVINNWGPNMADFEFVCDFIVLVETKTKSMVDAQTN